MKPSHSSHLERNEVSEELAGQNVELYDFPDRPLEVRWKGHLLPYRVFVKYQRVSHTAIVENKSLGHVLRVVKAQQDIQKAPTVQTNSSKGGYKSEAGDSTDQTTKSARRRQKRWK